MSTTEILTLDLHRLQATIGRDKDQRPTLVLTDGQTEVVLSSGDNNREDLAGARRIVDGVWDYQQLVVAQREAAYRMDRLERLHEIEHPDRGAAGITEASVDDDAARIAELRGTGASVSGAY